jgi:hypothetical protein
MPTASVRDIVSQTALEIGTSQVPVAVVFGSADQDIVQMGALLSAVADEVLLEEPYKISLGDGVWVEDKDGNPKIYPTVDTDRVRFDARLAINGLKYRFLQAKGYEFAEQLRDYTVRLNKLAGRTNAKVIDLDEAIYEGDREL